jgi:prepilin-type N-terminal cleavage/methylation domain-containing protein
MSRVFPNRQGFSLVEGLIAVALSGIVLAMATSVFVAQSRFYRDVSERSKVQENVRATAELVAADARTLTEGGIITATGTRLVGRFPVSMGMACGTASGYHATYFALDGKPVTDGDKSGWGVLWTDGVWRFFDVAFSTIYGNSAEPLVVQSCGSLGLDTLGLAKTDFVWLYIPGPEGNFMLPGLPIQLYGNTELRFADSDLQPGRLALFRGVGANQVEFATGFTTDSHFEYKVGTSWLQTPTALQLPLIKAIRVVIEASSEDPSLGPTEYGWTIDVPLRNIAGAGGGP